MAKKKGKSATKKQNNEVYKGTNKRLTNKIRKLMAHTFKFPEDIQSWDSLVLLSKGGKSPKGVVTKRKYKRIYRINKKTGLTEMYREKI